MTMPQLRPLAFLALGIALALLTAWLLYGVVQDGTAAARSGPAATTTTEIVVAKADIAPRTVVTAQQLVRRAYPAELLPGNALALDAEAIGRTTTTAIPAGAPVLRSHLADVGGDSGVSLTVEPGKVLVVFPTSDALTAAGLVAAGDRVDILATVTPTGADTARGSQTILQNLTVLDVIKPTQEQPQRATALVFVVDNQVALVLKYLRDGQALVDLAVRSRNAAELTKTTTVNLAYLVQTYGISR